MNRTDMLQRSITTLFRSGADADHTAEEMEELLDGIDFNLLLQAFLELREPVYAYRIDSDLEKGYAYRSAELFSGNAVQICLDDRGCCVDAAFHGQAYELWILPDASFVILSRIRTIIGNDESVLEYRTVKGKDWKAAGMSIDFPRLADDLDELCIAVKGHELPRYEL